MQFVQYEPINTSCIDTYNETSGNINKESNIKNKQKVLAYMNQGQGKYNNNFEKINSCVMPKETHEQMNLNKCYLRNDTNQVINQNFKNSTGGLLNQNPDIARKQILEGTGVYPDEGCSLSTENTDIFKQTIQDSAINIDLQNNKILTILKEKIQIIKDEITNLTINLIPNQEKILNNIINDYNITSTDCENQLQLQKKLMDKIPHIKYILYYNNNYKINIENYWLNVNNIGNKLVKQCNKKNISQYNFPHQITNRARDNYCMDVYQFNKSNIAPIVNWDCWGGPNQKWKIDDNERIISDFDGKCLDVLSGRTDDGAPIIQYDCHNGNNQKWFIDDKNRLHSRNAPNMCLDGGNDNNGARLHLANCSDSITQKFDGFSQQYSFNMKNIEGAGTLYPGDNGTVSGSTYCAGGWGKVSPGTMPDDGGWVEGRIDGQDKNMKCISGITYTDPRGDYYKGTDVNCDSIMADVAGQRGHWGYKCI